MRALRTRIVPSGPFAPAGSAAWLVVAAWEGRGGMGEAWGIEGGAGGGDRQPNRVGGQVPRFDVGLSKPHSHVSNEIATIARLASLLTARPP